MHASATANAPQRKPASSAVPKGHKRVTLQQGDIVLNVRDFKVSDSQLNEFKQSLQSMLTLIHEQPDKLELITSIVNEVQSHSKTSRPRGASATQTQIDFLIGDDPQDRAEHARAAQEIVDGTDDRETEMAEVSEIAATLGSSEVAKLLGIDASRVRHRQSASQLYSYMSGRTRRYPDWQFSDRLKSKVLPGLSTIIKSFPKETHPGTIRGLMTTPQETLLVNGQATTPRDWLIGGGDLNKVLGLIEGFLEY